MGIKERDHYLALAAIDGMARIKAQDQRERLERSDCISRVGRRGGTDEKAWPTFLDVIQYAILEVYKSGQMMERREEIGWHSYEVIELGRTKYGVRSLPGPALVIWTDA
jgi:hypothetical protein